MTSDEMLDELARIGQPTVRRFSDGTWYATLDLPAPNGVTLTVESDFEHASHREALATVLARLGDMRLMLSDPDRAELT